MATTTTETPAIETRLIGPADRGRIATLEEFMSADFEEGYLYELSRGVIEVSDIPGINHGRVVQRVARLFNHYDDAHPGVINYLAGGGECGIRLPGMISVRHPDQAVYLDPPPPLRNPWTRWIPHIVVEIVSPGGEERDYTLKLEEHLRAGVSEYWIIDPATRELRILVRDADVWSESIFKEGSTYKTDLLPGLEVRLEELIGVPEA
jgi:Uma2 family endonuclease